MKRVWAIALIVLGVGAVGFGATVIALAKPAQLHCDRQTCVWQRPGLFGARQVTLPTASLHDSRVEFSTHRTGVTTRWVVTGADGQLELATTDSDTQGDTFKRLAGEMQQLLTQRRDTFDAQFAPASRHGWIVLAIFGALAIAGGIYLMRA